MEKSGQLIKSFTLTLLLFVGIGLLLRGYAFSELPWQIYAPGAALFAIFNVYISPRFKKGKE